MTWTILAALTLGIWVAAALTVLYSIRNTRALDQVGAPQADDLPLPRLSIVVAAKNEERSTERALASLVAWTTQTSKSSTSTTGPTTAPERSRIGSARATGESRSSTSASWHPDGSARTTRLGAARKPPPANC